MSFAFTLNIKNKFIEFKKPAIMGVINRSPESFFNPANTLDVALKQIEVMVKDGANIIDVGGEATSPQVNLAAGPLLDEEINRVVSTVAAIKKHFDILVSVDTSKPQVMQAAVNAGADIINDQRALQLPGALEMAAKLNVPVCLMHFPSERQPGETSPEVLLQQVLADLTGFVKRAQTAGLNRQQLIIDLGFGQGHYGKNCSENFYLLKKLPAFAALDLPILVGWSRKSMIGKVLGNVPASERLYGSIAAAVIAALQGASILRVHDVKATHDAIAVTHHYQNAMAVKI